MIPAQPSSPIPPTQPVPYPAAPPAAAPPVIPAWFLVAFLALVAAIGALMVNRQAPAPAPAVADPIPADTLAWLQAEVDALDSVGNSVDAAPADRDPAKITAAIGQARKAANDRLVADVMAKPGGQGFHEVAATMRKLVRGAK